MGSDLSQFFAWDDPEQRKQTGKALSQILDGLVSGFHKKVDEEGVVVEQPVVKKGRGRRQSKNNKDEAATSAGQADQQPEVKLERPRKMPSRIS